MNVIERRRPSLRRPPSKLERHDFRCERCGYGAVACIAPARCPMCGSAVWVLALDPGAHRRVERTP